MPSRWNCAVERALQSLHRIYTHRDRREKDQLSTKRLLDDTRAMEGLSPGREAGGVLILKTWNVLSPGPGPSPAPSCSGTRGAWGSAPPRHPAAASTASCPAPSACRADTCNPCATATLQSSSDSDTEPKATRVASYPPRGRTTQQEFPQTTGN